MEQKTTHKKGKRTQAEWGKFDTVKGNQWNDQEFFDHPWDSPLNVQELMGDRRRDAPYQLWWKEPYFEKYQ